MNSETREPNFLHILFLNRSNIRDTLHDFLYIIKWVIKRWHYKGDGRFPSFISLSQIRAEYPWVRWEESPSGVHYLGFEFTLCFPKKTPRPKANLGGKHSGIFEIKVHHWRKPEQELKAGTESETMEERSYSLSLLNNPGSAAHGQHCPQWPWSHTTTITKKMSHRHPCGLLWWRGFFHGASLFPDASSYVKLIKNQPAHLF